MTMPNHADNTAALRALVVASYLDSLGLLLALFDRGGYLCHDGVVYFEIIGEFSAVETIAVGSRYP